MKINQIRYFLAICDKRNFSRAAIACNVKQPSLTEAIQRLEQSTGGQLFDRSSYPVRLTKLGTRLHPIYKQINKLVEKSRSISKRSSS
jgi:LysR family transcriptional regulator, hydrogen peroxide-inducible genes activator